MRTLVLSLGASLLVATACTAVGCGGSDTNTPDNDASTGTTGARPPARPSSGSPTSTKRTFAIKQLLLGDTSRSGSKSADAWRAYGYDLDGQSSTGDSKDVCTHPGRTSSHEDGDQARDNSFGRNIIKFIQQAGQSNPTTTLTENIGKGSFGILLQVDGLEDTASQTATGLKGQVLLGGKLASAPTFDKTFDWPTRADSTPVNFSNAYVVDGKFVSGDPTDVKLSLVFSGLKLTVNIKRAQISFDYKSPNKAANGLITGILDTAEFVAEVQRVGGAIAASLCPGGSLAADVKSTLEEASDIRTDGSNGASSACNGISVGIGFEAEEVGNPTKTVPAETEGEICK